LSSDAEIVAPPRELTYIQAVNEALRWALAEYPEAVFYGEDVALPGGAYGASKGLHRDFGDRVFDTPISETAMLGAAVGAAMRGLRPIVEIMFADFFLVALDQLVNQAANIRYVSRGGFGCPITVRSQQAATPGACAQHSQSLEAFFAHVPGIRIGLAADGQQAYELLRAAIASDDPVVILECRALYQQRREIVLGGPVESIGGARRVRFGDDVSLVSWGRMVGEAEAAASVLAERGIEADVLDLRWLSPLDLEAVFESVGRTGRLVVAHEANLTGGFGAEIAARVAGEAFWSLDAPIERVATPDVRIPAAPRLQAALLPDASAIVAAAERTIRS
jgi:pyruvate/2-oxoglutarate/acetoin dehydrogenase E1 component